MHVSGLGLIPSATYLSGSLSLEPGVIPEHEQLWHKKILETIKMRKLKAESLAQGSGMVDGRDITQRDRGKSFIPLLS